MTNRRRIRLWGVAAYALPAFLASALLFSLEPMTGKLLLPRLGGVPAIWNTCLLFFQGTLLAGYAYAHFGVQRLGVRRHAVLHLVVLVLSLAFLPPALGSSEPPVASSPIPWVLRELLRGVGLPFFLISATAPLVQRWFAASGDPRAGDPYFLYAASNLGSLTGLLLYPLLLEPLAGLNLQARLWSATYVGFALLVAVLALRARNDQAGTAEPCAAPIPAGQVRQWVLLAALPSALLLTVTGYITTDVAPMPLLWLLPLGLYLLTFAVAFAAGQRTGGQTLARTLQPCAVLLALAILSGFNPLWMVLAHLAVFGAAAYLAHTRLAAQRPPAAQLTAFYLWLSVGGVIGGVFGAIVAPLVLMPELEYVLLLLVAILVTAEKGSAHSRSVHFALLTIGALLVGALLAGALGHPALGVSALALLLVGLGGRRVLSPARVGFIVIVVLASTGAAGANGIIARERNFFGTLRVRELGSSRQLLHGRTVHGVQLTADGQLETPTSYYAREGPFGDVFAALLRRPATVAIVGVGAGTAACYATPGEEWDLFEIDPAVVALARDTMRFHFLSRCAPGARVILGDGRRSLEDVSHTRYDLLVLDAFSSGAIPSHLLTLEAFQLYRTRLHAAGLLAVHISNKYLDLAPVLAANASRLGLHAFRRVDEALTGERRSPSTWVVLSPSAEAAAAFAADARWQRLLPDPGFRGWTDDRASLLPVLKGLR